jgi:hypothetical protein
LVWLEQADVVATVAWGTDRLEAGLTRLDPLTDGLADGSFGHSPEQPPVGLEWLELGLPQHAKGSGVRQNWAAVLLLDVCAGANVALVDERIDDYFEAHIVHGRR